LYYRAKCPAIKKKTKKEGKTRRESHLMHSGCTEVRWFGKGLTERFSEDLTERGTAI
jgi:hypothetical protein